MKIVSLRDAKAGLSACVDQAQGERVLITRHGKPAALLIGVEGDDLEDLLTRANPKFWEMLEERRRSDAPRLSLEAVEARYAADVTPPPAQRPRVARKRRSG